MTKKVIWKSASGQTIESLSLTEHPDHILIESIIIGVEEDKPLYIHYQIHLNKDWQVLECKVRSEQETLFHLQSNGNGSWTDGHGQPLPHLSECIDIDLSCTPFTNTLPIRRLNLYPHQSADIQVVYIDVISGQIVPAKQQYHHLGAQNCPITYAYLSYTSGFSSEIIVDQSGLVVDYPQLYIRLY
ncbi:putative glycolipid-binding domain-containing protein [Hazenella sp. IB182353]|uniref:putative glycolipid-binding domain-containing protein n=1 Tax=Polycladospora coralii TaxID=2771432 RepID=UPI0017479B85|nr:putative glycolipid-binding domain-containing protein [Polycladospora coralii]MBS7530220.1 putative glycolipid-binding domain-containing protein [Polycladospora coralii]